MFAGALHETMAEPLRGVARTVVGAPGMLIGVTAVEEVEATELPMTLVATTLKV